MRPKNVVVTERLDRNIEIGFEEIGQECVVGLMLWNRVYISGNLYCHMLLLICILLLSYSFIFFRFYFLSMYTWFYSCLTLR